jgi:hypothetical protein
MVVSQLKVGIFCRIVSVIDLAPSGKEELRTCQLETALVPDRS